MKTNASAKLFAHQPAGVAIVGPPALAQAERESAEDHVHLAQRIQQFLAAEPGLQRVHLAVEVFTSIAQLHGVVGSARERDHCVRVAARVPGIHAVRDCIRVSGVDDAAPSH